MTYLVRAMVRTDIRSSILHWIAGALCWMPCNARILICVIFYPLHCFFFFWSNYLWVLLAFSVYFSLHVSPSISKERMLSTKNLYISHLSSYCPLLSIYPHIYLCMHWKCEDFLKDVHQYMSAYRYICICFFSYVPTSFHCYTTALELNYLLTNRWSYCFSAHYLHIFLKLRYI